MILHVYHIIMWYVHAHVYIRMYVHVVRIYKLCTHVHHLNITIISKQRLYVCNNLKMTDLLSQTHAVTDIRKYVQACVCTTFSVPMSAIFLMSCAPHMAPTGMYTPWGCDVKQMVFSTAGSARIVGEPICKRSR